jgi:hypothetical protein
LNARAQLGGEPRALFGSEEVLPVQLMPA